VTLLGSSCKRQLNNNNNSTQHARFMRAFYCLKEKIFTLLYRLDNSGSICYPTAPMLSKKYLLLTLCYMLIMAL